VVPGSHRRGRPELEPGAQPAGWTEIRGRPGDAVLFDRRIWHSASANHSAVDRVAVFYGYSYRWLRPKSAMATPRLTEVPSPIRRQLLGAATGSNGYFEPTDEDVPLRSWLAEHAGGEDAGGATR
jgi:ectoine hydroxylase-related dioxygenase (phytanoyl-CoA dioxygenase family)